MTRTQRMESDDDDAIIVIVVIIILLVYISTIMERWRCTATLEAVRIIETLLYYQ